MTHQHPQQPLRPLKTERNQTIITVEISSSVITVITTDTILLIVIIISPLRLRIILNAPAPPPPHLPTNKPVQLFKRKRTLSFSPREVAPCVALELPLLRQPRRARRQRLQQRPQKPSLHRIDPRQRRRAQPRRQLQPIWQLLRHHHRLRGRALQLMRRQ